MKDFTRISKEIDEFMNLDNYLANLRTYHIDAFIDAQRNNNKKLMGDEQCLIDIYEKAINENEISWDAKLKEMKEWIDANEKQNQLN